MKTKTIIRCLFAQTLIAGTIPAFAAPALPDIQPNLPRPEVPARAPAPTVPADRNQNENKVEKSSVKITVKEFTFTGNKQFTSNELSDLLAGYLDHPIDLNELNAAVNTVRNHYRQKGFVLTQVYLEAKQVQKASEESSSINMIVLEGTMGDVKVESANGLNNERFQSMAEYDLQKGDIVSEKNLVRNMMMINGLPGVTATSQLNPGQEVGSSDVVISVEPEPKFLGTVYANTYGNRYTGREQAGFGMVWNNPNSVGDQLTVSGRVSNNEGLRTFGVGYSTPITAAGTILSLGYSYVDYHLGREFKVLDAKGDAQYFTAAIEHPLIRDVKKGVSFRTALNYKILDDDVGGFNLNNRRDITSMDIGFVGDWLNGAGDVVYQWGASITPGNVSFKDGNAKALDASSLKTSGSFLKWNLTSTRTQFFNENIIWTLRADYQGASDNLDIVEKIGIGAINRWRPYAELPNQAAEGVMVGTDLRKKWAVTGNLSKALDVISPFAFYDIGKGKINHNALSGDNSVLSHQIGAGIDLQFKQKWTFSLSFSEQKRQLEGTSTENESRLWGQLRKDF